jgi:hypothetical protein
MTAIRPMFSSNGNDGDMITIAQTVTAGTNLHTAIAGTNHIDEVYVYACNIHTADVLLTLEMNGATAAHQKKVTVPYNDGDHLVVAGARINNGATIAAFAGTANVINCTVIVNRYIDPETAS